MRRVKMLTAVLCLAAAAPAAAHDNKVSHWNLQAPAGLGPHCDTMIDSVQWIWLRDDGSAHLSGEDGDYYGSWRREGGSLTVHTEEFQVTMPDTLVDGASLQSHVVAGVEALNCPLRVTDLTTPNGTRLAGAEHQYEGDDD